MAETDFGKFIEAVAKHPDIWGDPNPRFKNKNELRWGSHGARSIRIDKGTFFDNEMNEGGGVLDLIIRELSCDKAAAIEWLAREGFPVNGERKRKREPDPIAEKREIVAEYEYCDAAGKPLFVVVRFRPKEFRQRKADQKAGEKWNVKGVPQVPYNLPACIAAIERGEPIFGVEGEKDVENLRDLLGVTATCNAGGAGKWTVEHSRCLQGADIIWLPDNDDAGRSHVAGAALLMQAHARRQRVLDLPELEEKEDVSDWIDRDPENDKGALLALVDRRGRVWRPEPPDSKFGAVMWEHLDDPAEEHEYIIDEFFTAGDLGMIAGPSKSGKSFLAIHAAFLISVAAVPVLDHVNADFFGRKVLAGGLVIYQAGEGARGVKKRLRAWRREFNVPSDVHLPLVLLTKRVNLFKGDDVDKLIAEIKAWQAYYNMPLKMVFVDTWATAMPGADENSAKDVTAALLNCARIKDECGCAVCLVHHMNAAGTKIRGSTAIPANLDNVILVTRDEVTKIRTAILDKQKDDEDDKSFRFELKSVNLGYRKDGKPITSCVCLEVGEKDASARAERNQGFVLKDEEPTFFDGLLWALRNHGIVPPPEVTISPTIPCVVEFKHFAERVGKKLWRDDGDDAEKHKERVKKRIQRHGRSLIKFGIIGRETVTIEERERHFIWWTGKPVKGFSKTPIAPPEERADDLMSVLDDEGASYADTGDADD